MELDLTIYGPVAHDMLIAAGYPQRRMPLVIGDCSAPDVRAQLKNKKASAIFPMASHPEAALSGLYLYIGCFEEAHLIAQDIKDADGSYWHAILHRQEPDAFNAGYWFNRVGQHPLFSALADEAEALGYGSGGEWDPIAFIRYAEDSGNRNIATEVQHAEWQLLWRHCAKSK